MRGEMIKGGVLWAGTLGCVVIATPWIPVRICCRPGFPAHLLTMLDPNSAAANIGRFASVSASRRVAPRYHPPVSIVLVSANGDLKVSAWTWGPIHDVVASAGILPADRWEMTRYNCSTELDEQQAATLADFLESSVLARLGAGERLLADGTVTDLPDDGTFHRDDLSRNYSVRREMLVRIIDFLRAAKGPVRVD
jgi:hypothetical protein